MLLKVGVPFVISILYLNCSVFSSFFSCIIQTKLWLSTLTWQLSYGKFDDWNNATKSFVYIQNSLTFFNICHMRTMYRYVDNHNSGFPVLSWCWSTQVSKCYTTTNYDKFWTVCMCCSGPLLTKHLFQGV